MTDAMIGGSKRAMASELCQSVAFVFTNTRSSDISLALMDAVTIFTKLTGCRFTISVACNGTMKLNDRAEMVHRSTQTVEKKRDSPQRKKSILQLS